MNPNTQTTAQTEEEVRKEYINRETRLTALHLAVDLAKIGDNNSDHTSVVRSAQAFEAYLKG